jgi:hypothetical protein
MRNLLSNLGGCIIFLMFVLSCTNNEEVISLNDENVTPLKENPFKVSEEEAKERLAFVMNQLEPVKTYGSSKRNIKNVHAWRIDKQTIKTYSSVEENEFDWSDVDTLLYIINFEDDKGFAFVSADNRTESVLAIIDEGSMTVDDFLNIDNPGFIAFMNNAVSILLSQIAMNNEPIATYAISESEQSDMVQTQSAPVYNFSARLKTKWGQGNPYNRQCPIVSGVRAPTGCVITAGAQALSFFQTIDTVSWSHSDQSGSSALSWTQIISDCEDWSWAVPNERWSHFSDYYGNNIYGYGRIGDDPLRATTDQMAHLMRYLGVNIDATYTDDGTSAYTQNLLNFLRNSCGLTSSSSTLTTFNPAYVISIFSDPNTLILIEAFTSTSVGHAWIIDGAQIILNSIMMINKLYLHCNYMAGIHTATAIIIILVLIVLPDHYLLTPTLNLVEQEISHLYII